VETIVEGRIMNCRILLSSLLCVAAGSSFAASKLLQDMPLKWTPTETFAEMGPVDVSGALLSTKVRFDTFVDTRQNPTVVGENRERKAEVRPVTTSANVADFVTNHLRDGLHAAGVTTVDTGADVTISGEVREFFVTETSQYRGSLGLFVTVRNSKGKEIWSGVILGGAEHFGRSYKAENYCETMSDMVLRATYNLLANPGFHQALQNP
jgi:Lipopolysaccharide-assembly